MDKWETANIVAESMKMSRRWVIKQAVAGKYLAMKIGGKWFIAVEDNGWPVDGTKPKVSDPAAKEREAIELLKIRIELLKLRKEHRELEAEEKKEAKQ